MELTKLHRERAVDAVYQALRQAIISNGLKPGERLNVDDLARRLGVSLTPIRGAVQQLATEGLVEIRPRSGTFVASLNAKDVEETFRIRCALECLAAEDAITRMSAAEIRRMRDQLKHLRRVPKSTEECEAHERHRADLHQVILTAAGNRRLQEIYDALNAHIKIARLTIISLADLGSRIHQEYLNHEAIVDAFEARDLERACKALRNQMNHVKTALMAGLADEIQSESDEALTAS